MELALESLRKTAGITGNWKPNRVKELDGKLELKLNNTTIKFNADIKQEVRGNNLPQIKADAERYDPLIVVAQYILPKIKEELRENGIAYLETNGNIFLKQKRKFCLARRTKDDSTTYRKEQPRFYQNRFENSFLLFDE